MTPAFEERLSADPQALRGLRKRARSALRVLHVSPHDAETVLLVLDELVSNAIEHGAVYRKRGKPLRATLAVDGGDLVLGFGDDDMPSAKIALMAKAMAAGDIGLPDLEDERGRGLYLVLTSMQQVEVEDRTAAAEGMRLRGRFPGIAGG